MSELEKVEKAEPTAIEKAVDEILQSDDTKRMIRNKLNEAMAKAIESCFDPYSEITKTIKARMNEIMVPCIERYDFSQYFPKLDTILTELANATLPAQNRRILDNFKTLMEPPKDDQIMLHDIFEAYCKFVKDNISTDHLEVDTSDGRPKYEPITCTLLSEDITYDRSCFRTIRIELSHSIDEEHDLRYWFTISRIMMDSDAEKISEELEYTLSFETNPTIDGLANIDKFEAYLLSLDRCRVKITEVGAYGSSFEDEVELDEEPEPHF